MVGDLIKFILACVVGVGLQLGWLWLCTLIPFPFGVIVWLGGYLVLALGWRGTRGSYRSDEDAGGL